MIIREIRENELSELLELYTHLHERGVPENSGHLQKTWKTICGDENHHIIVCEADGKLVSSCVCVIIPNLTRSVRPYAFIENVVTRSDYRGRGCAKMMLLTGSKSESTLDFYKRAGYNSADKTAFIQWL